MVVGSISIIDDNNFMGMDLWATIDEQLHEHSPELGTLLVPLVQAKTPVLTGALQSDMTYEAYPDPEPPGGGDEDLVYVYAAGDAQMATWQRIYVQYQEGGPLGLPTYTNPPRQMFYKTADSDGLTETAEWAYTYVEYAELLCVSGAGVSI